MVTNAPMDTIRPFYHEKMTKLGPHFATFVEIQYIWNFWNIIYLFIIFINMLTKSLHNVLHIIKTLARRTLNTVQTT